MPLLVRPVHPGRSGGLVDRRRRRRRFFVVLLSSVSREKATEVLFETLSTPAVHMALQPVLALYACGPSSGMVVDVGESGTQVSYGFR